MPKFGDIVRVVELGAKDVAHAVGIVEGVVGELVDVVTFAGGVVKHLQAIPVVSHATATSEDATDQVYPEGKAAVGSTAHVAVPIDDQAEELVTTDATAASSPTPASLPAQLQAPTQ